jgi:enoyl-CoA hydratase/carnithine racemase
MSEIITERSGSILRIQLNRPDRKNALTSNMYSTLAELLRDAARDDLINVVVLHGAGDSFCAGNDMMEFANYRSGEGVSAQTHLVEALIDFDKPLIAAVQGAAVGSGMTILTHCDFVYASESAKFIMPFINLGLVPEYGSSYSVPARIGHIRAAELIMLGQPFDAKRASELGIVTRVVPAEKLFAKAIETAQQLTEKPSGALQACKRLMKRSSREQIEQAVRIEHEEFSARLLSAEAKEAIAAFLDKRPPKFR